jgi:hypothetical protein
MSLNKFDSSDEDLDSNQQQSWLMPYANMMCLMAGFFAVLYTLNGGKLNSSVSGAALSAIGSRSPDALANATLKPDNFVTNEIPKDFLDKYEQQKKLIETLSVQAEKLQKEVNHNKMVLNENNSSSSVLLTQKKALENEIEKLNEAQKKAFEQIQIEQAEKQKLTEQIKLSEYQKIAEQQIRDKKENEIKRKEVQLKSKDSQISQSNQNMEYTKNIIETQESQIAQLRAQLGEAKTELSNLPQNLMFLLKWNSPQDLDLTVTDPKGRKFDLKRRNVASEGSGSSEFWQSENFAPGQYRLRVTYNPGPVGSKQNASFVIRADSSRDSKETLNHTVDTNNRVKEIMVNVSEKGQISFN